MNKVFLFGNMGKDPKIATLTNAKVANFTLATNEGYYDKDKNWVEKTEWHNISCWGYTADKVEKNGQKGKRCIVEGSIQTRSYEKDGQTVYMTEIKADKVIFVDKNDMPNDFPI